MTLPDYVRAGTPISASNMNKAIGILRAQPWRTHARGMPRSRAVGAAAEKPFEITLSQRDGVWYARSAAGKWFGRGTGGAVHGVMPRYSRDSSGKLVKPWPDIGEDFFDTFQIHACEWELGTSIVGKRFVFFVMAKDVYGGGFVASHPRIYMAEGVVSPPSDTTESELDKLLFRDNFVAFSIVADVSVRLSATIGSYKIDVLQILSGDYHYTPPQCTTAPFVFHRVHATTNTWRCLGGVVRVNPVRWRSTGWYYFSQDTSTSTENAEKIWEDESYKNNLAFCEAVAGTEISFGEDDVDKMGDGVVVFLDVTVFTNSQILRASVQCDWIIRSLETAGLSRSETSASEHSVSSEMFPLLKTSDEPQTLLFEPGAVWMSGGNISFSAKLVEGVNGTAQDGSIDAGIKRFRTAVPMAIFRRVGNSKFVEVQTLCSGVVEIRPQLELQRYDRAGPWSPYVYSGCEGAVSQGAKEEAQIATEEAKVISESGNAPTETAAASTYALEDADFAAVARGASGEEAQG